MLLNKKKKLFRIVALLEGLSYLFLIFIAMPIKYLAQNDSYVKLSGMPHGVLFVLYVLVALSIRHAKKWNKTTFLIILLASLIPFGTFYVDHKYLRD